MMIALTLLSVTGGMLPLYYTLTSTNVLDPIRNIIYPDKYRSYRSTDYLLADNIA
jgi:hypothetical protein